MYRMLWLCGNMSHECNNSFDLQQFILKHVFKELNISYRREIVARNIALSYIKNIKTLETSFLEKYIKNKRINIIGPSEIKRSVKSGTNVVVDKALSNALELKIKPDIIVTDLDGDVDKIINLSKFLNVIVVAHIHSDNIYRFINNIKRIKNVIVTTQIEPIDKIYNFGGFTDGDRAVYLAKHFGAREINIYGFDFNHVISYTNNVDVKRKKLRIAKKIIERIEEINFY